MLATTENLKESNEEAERKAENNSRASTAYKIKQKGE